MCNDRSRFINFTPTPSDELLVVGTTAVHIKGRRTVSITMEYEKTESTLDGKRTFQLYNVAYIPSFTTNIVYYNQFYNKGIYQDLENQCLKYNRVIVGKTPRKFSQQVLEYNTVDLAIALPAISSRKPLLKVEWTIEQAYKRTGHTYLEALQHLPEACSDIAKVKGKHDPHC